MKAMSYALFCSLLLIGFSCPVAAAPPEGKGKPEKTEQKVKEKKGKNKNKKAKGLTKRAERQFRNLRRNVNKLSSRFNRADGALIAELIAKYGDDTDSDEDTLSDLLELILGTKACENDSDGDGIDDPDEYEDGDSIGEDDENEVEVENLVSELSDTSITVGGVTFILNENTEFEGEDDEELSAEDFAVGDCVEVEGTTQEDSSIIAEEVEKKAAEKCDEEDDDDEDDDDEEDDDEEEED